MRSTVLYDSEPEGGSSRMSLALNNFFVPTTPVRENYLCIGKYYIVPSATIQTLVGMFFTYFLRKKVLSLPNYILYPK